jgi:MazG family protein
MNTNMTENELLGEEFTRLYGILSRLRRECPWDRKQTAASLRQYLLEEVYEVIDTIDHEDWPELSKELGDLLLQIVFQSVIAEEHHHFKLVDVVRHINRKMIERHPHVFGEIKVASASDVADNWEHIKLFMEKRPSLLAGVPKSSSALLRAQRIQEKASRVGFDWPEVEQVLEKVEEEISELREALKTGREELIRDEFGDLLFSLVNFGRFIDLVAEDALRLSIEKFTTRFELIEKYYNHDYEKLKSASLEELDRVWESIKDKQNDRDGE